MYFFNTGVGGSQLGLPCATPLQMNTVWTCATADRVPNSHAPAISRQRTSGIRIALDFTEAFPSSEDEAIAAHRARWKAGSVAQEALERDLLLARRRIVCRVVLDG